MTLVQLVHLWQNDSSYLTNYLHVHTTVRLYRYEDSNKDTLSL